MARNQAQNRPGIAEAKSIVLDAIRQGRTVDWALTSVGRHPRTYEAWRKNDPAFRDDVDLVRARRSNGVDRPKMTFEEFRRDYLGSATFDHQSNMIDIIEGREPRWLHPAMTYEPRSRQHILINVPPDHAKTVSVSIDWVTYLICTNPNERIVLVSKTQELAKQMLWAIKQRLTHPKYARLQADYGPSEGFNSGDAIWQADRIYLPSTLRDPEEKDPTVQCVGIGSQIYGVRSTRIILDDAVLLSNAAQHEAQRRWLNQEVITRLGDTGQLIIVGTRVDVPDLYSELRNPDNYPDEGEPPWSYLGMPAVLEAADASEDWVTLWPRSDQKWANGNDVADSDGLYPRWSGPKLAKRRALVGPRIWSLVYQQQTIPSDSIFQASDIKACTNGNRTVGPMREGNPHHREGGMQGLYVICSMDPAMAGETATIAYAVDPKTLKRYVLEAHRMRAPSPQAIRDLITSWTDKYSPMCWVIEKNAFQLFLTRDESIRSFLASRGVSLLEHYSSNNKLDPDFGVASLAPLFTERMIELPSSHNSGEGIKALIEQLITWRPGVKGKDLVQDMPMALWFAEIKAREVVAARTMRANAHANSKYVPRYRRGAQQVVRIDEWINRNQLELAS